MYIEKADEKSLRMVRAMLEVDQEEDFWDTLPEYVKEDVGEAKLQSKKGKSRLLQKYLRNTKNGIRNNLVAKSRTEV